MASLKLAGWALIGAMLLAGGCQAASPPDPVVAADPEQIDSQINYVTYALLEDLFERVRGDYVNPVSMTYLLELTLRGIEVKGTRLPPGATGIVDAGIQRVRAAPNDQARRLQFVATMTQLAGDRAAEHVRLLRIGTREMVAGLDPSSSMAPTPLPTTQFGGVGLELSERDGGVVVVGALPESPASQAGIQPGDMLTEIDGQPVSAGKLEVVVEQLRGPVGSTAQLVLRRPGVAQPFVVTVVRRVVRGRSLTFRVDAGVAIIRPVSFNEDTVVRMRNALAAATAEAGGRLSGLVLDLRGNTGGLLDAAIATAGTLLPAGAPVASVRARHQADTRDHTATGGSLPQDVPIVVVVNSGTAAGAELVAASLQRSRALILGHQSVSAATVQTVILLRPFPLSGTGRDAMRITTAVMMPPGGPSWQRRGIVPDILVPAGPDFGGVTPEARRPGALPAPPGFGADGGSPARNPWRDRFRALRAKLLPTPPSPDQDFAIAQAIRVVQLLQAS